MRNSKKVSEMYETTLSAFKDEGNERMWFNTNVRLAKVRTAVVHTVHVRDPLCRFVSNCRRQ